MRQGCHQLLLNPEARKIATFSNPCGNMRSKRLIFGAKASQDLFDEAIYQISGTYQGDSTNGMISCYKEETWRNTTRHWKQSCREQRTLESRSTLTSVSLESRRYSPMDYGYKFTKDGLKPNPEKIRAVKESSPPKLKWRGEENEGIEKLKASITSESTMAYFHPAKQIVVRTEASYHEGLSAGLFQKTGSSLQPAHFISRTMTDTEKRYSQTEKDAVHWAKGRFSIYLLGAPKFKIITIHKPLLPLFNKAAMRRPPKIEKKNASWECKMTTSR